MFIGSVPSNDKGGFKNSDDVEEYDDLKEEGDDKEEGEEPAPVGAVLQYLHGELVGFGYWIKGGRVLTVNNNQHGIIVLFANKIKTQKELKGAGDEH